MTRTASAARTVPRSSQSTCPAVPAPTVPAAGDQVTDSTCAKPLASTCRLDLERRDRRRHHRANASPSRPRTAASESARRDTHVWVDHRLVHRRRVRRRGELALRFIVQARVADVTVPAEVGWSISTCDGQQTARRVAVAVRHRAGEAQRLVVFQSCPCSSERPVRSAWACELASRRSPEQPPRACQLSLVAVHVVVPVGRRIPSAPGHRFRLCKAVGTGKHNSRSSEGRSRDRAKPVGAHREQRTSGCPMPIFTSGTQHRPSPAAVLAGRNSPARSSSSDAGVTKAWTSDGRH